MDILFVTDYVCPYCLIAKEALRRALEKTGLTATIQYHPFELTPEPKERVDTWNDPRRRIRYKRLAWNCQQLGLDMKLPPEVIPRPYTRLAFEGWHYACEQGLGDAYSDLVYRAYFTDEQDIGDMAVLTALAERAGLDAAEFAKALEDGRYTEKQRQAVQYASETLQVMAVPTIFIDGRRITLLEYSEEEMIRILQEHREDA